MLRSQRQPGRGSQGRGVTLIELMVTLVILAMLLIGAGPSIGSWIRNTQVRNTASSMLAGLNRARNEAMRRNTLVRFSLVSLTDSSVMDTSCALSGSGVSWVISVNDPSGHCNYAPSTVPIDANDPMIVETSAGGVGGKTAVAAGKLADGSAAATTVTFNSFGRVADAAPIGFINISNSSAGSDYRRLRIEIEPGGKVRLCDLGVTANTDPRYCPTRATP
jgi:type IV fimbrial biogenesis protein FimT